MTDLRPGQVGLLAGPGPAEAEAVEAAVRVGPGEAEGARPAGGALHALHVGLAGAVAVGVAAAVALLVALVLQGARRVAVARPAERKAAWQGGKKIAKSTISCKQDALFCKHLSFEGELEVASSFDHPCSIPVRSGHTSPPRSPRGSDRSPS